MSSQSQRSLSPIVDSNVMDVATQVRGIIAQHLKKMPEEIPLHSKLETELEIDSMSMIEINVSLEERFRVAMPDMVIASNVTTVFDLAQYIHSKLGEVRP